ncbi:hypothetical protein H9L12_07830 [Sphingomonas rhizophila]|uniref:Uncharacterized protein n=1 Tax=Sphingomonas rhizophila TaxID=2071607 RepID=A0A7G9S8U2_9SPHN|nr:hypothetical protein [Sphingomonas rhizophila]QNN64267.1 hypothetical protein H9L12_07830 [Sphingomonas rhizophila]
MPDGALVGSGGRGGSMATMGGGLTDATVTTGAVDAQADSRKAGTTAKRIRRRAPAWS